MPVGNSDKGVGLWAGQVMFTLDNVDQYIDWWHGVLPDSGESFEHEGTLSSFVFNPGLTVGLSNYWNVSFNQIFGYRFMTWEGDSTTIHHRNEGTHTDFVNAIGGVLGDSRVLFRYLVYNDGQGEGRRFFMGAGLSIPSNNTLTSDPFFLDGKEKTEHRHFSISDGAYKGIIEAQYFRKRHANPVFIGGSLSIETPLHTNKYGYKPPVMYDLSITALTQEIPRFKLAVSSSLLLRHSSVAYWNGIEAPNSRATMLTGGLGAVFATKNGGFTVSIQIPYFVGGRFAGIEAGVEQSASAYQLSIGYRRLFDYIIPWLDPLKDL